MSVTPMTLLACILLATVALLPAAELVVRDLNLSLSVLPTAFDYTLTSPTVSRSGSDAFASGTELAFGGRYALARPGDALGLVVGAEVFSDTWTYGSSGYLFAGGLRVSAGLGWAITDNWTLLAEPGVRYGVSSFSSPSSATGPAYTASGSFSGYDGRVAVLWQVANGLLIDAHGGWLSASHDQSGDNIKQTIDQSGLYVGLGVVWRWSTAPTRIE